jgi:hypothetical protein
MMTALFFGMLGAAGSAVFTAKKRYGLAVWCGLLAIAEFIVLGAILSK